jgi:hypothetical protein
VQSGESVASGDADAMPEGGKIVFLHKLKVELSICAVLLNRFVTKEKFLT